MSHQIPPAVRILPMDSTKEEFPKSDKWSPEKVQTDFFLGEMAYSGHSGRYQFRKQGMDAEPGTIVLFQFDSQIIATAVLIRIEQYDRPEGDYNGAFFFNPLTIRTFNKVGAELVRKYWPEKFKRFRNTKWDLDPAHYSAFDRELSGIKYAVPQAHDLEAHAAARLETMVSRIVRDAQRSWRVKSLHEHRCQLLTCEHTIVLPDGSHYAEAHHIKPLGAPHDGPDIEQNIICLCPNHHAACDFGAIQLTATELRQVPGHMVGQNFLDYHNQEIYGVRRA